MVSLKKYVSFILVNENFCKNVFRFNNNNTVHVSVKYIIIT